MADMKNADRIFAGKSRRNRPLGRHRGRWQSNITNKLDMASKLVSSDSEDGPVASSCKRKETT
jgi:hypothetical protein